MDKSRNEEIARMVIATTIPFDNFEVSKVSFAKCSGSLPKNIVMERIRKAKTHLDNRDLTFGTWDTLDLDLEVDTIYAMHPENFTELSEKMERLTTFFLNYFVIDIEGKNPILGLRFYSYAEVTN